ncbi:glycoside hydrolase family 3 C-terminal domain-containing protein [Streptomyces sp. CC0208]|uniref:glycoside hydrolase family 3 C-terminal domain-containing protein n=1 Tax=Streptomyces sp. CC0208 TaxID=2306165 RepID=UPI001F08CDD8|nr:glycoside hydrolase family 3 C-terminal domain-containing protein [Streptomyces sp. CC0208]
MVWTSHGGQETGRAPTAVLLGEADPTSRLRYRGDDELPHPLDYDVIKAGRTYQCHRTASLYPFGQGLSYADFAHDHLGLSTATVAQGGTLDVTVRLSDTGTRSGSEGVQLYARALDARCEAPRLKLAGFRKVRLDWPWVLLLAVRQPRVRPLGMPARVDDALPVAGSVLVYR